MGKESRILDFYLSSKADLNFLFGEENDENTKDNVKTSFSESVRAKKDTNTYNAHSYPTKVPPEGIVPFLNYYTKAGDKVLDPFCGSGMTGLATKILKQKTNKNVDVVLNDLGVAATHIAFNYNNDVDAPAFLKQYSDIRKKLMTYEATMYKTFHVIGKSPDYSNLTLKKVESAKTINAISNVKEVKTKTGSVEVVEAKIVTTIWSEYYSCLNCDSELILWDLAMNPKTGKMADSFNCPDCKKKHSRSDFSKPEGQKMAHVVYEYFSPERGKLVRHERNIEAIDFEVYEKYHNIETTKWHPKDKISEKREMMTMGPSHLGIKRICDFYTERNLHVCSEIWHEIEKVKDLRIRSALMFAATNTFWHATKMRRFNVKGGMRPLTGTLYIPQISAECNVFRVLDKKVKELGNFYSINYKKDATKMDGKSFHLNESATNLKSVPESSIDYIFTDPPFGGNIFYSDCNIIWEGWLGQLTNDKEEILFNRSRKPTDGGKTREDYHLLMNQAFAEMYRVLKPGKWASVVFNNSDNDVLEGFIRSAQIAGFEIADVNFFDKDQKSVKGYMGQKGTQNVTNLDIVLNVRKPLVLRKLSTIKAKSVSDKVIYKVLTDYLENLPKMMKKKDSAYTEEHKTLPFLHSMLLRHFIKNNLDLKELSLERIINVCELIGLMAENGKLNLESRAA
jgi:DNA modification methylase